MNSHKLFAQRKMDDDYLVGLYDNRRFLFHGFDDCEGRALHAMRRALRLLVVSLMRDPKHQNVLVVTRFGSSVLSDIKFSIYEDNSLAITSATEESIAFWRVCFVDPTRHLSHDKPNAMPRLEVKPCSVRVCSDLAEDPFKENKGEKAPDCVLIHCSGKKSRPAVDEHEEVPLTYVPSREFFDEKVLPILRTKSHDIHMFMSDSIKNNIESISYDRHEAEEAAERAEEEAEELAERARIAQLASYEEQRAAMAERHHAKLEEAKAYSKAVHAADPNALDKCQAERIRKMQDPLYRCIGCDGPHSGPPSTTGRCYGCTGSEGAARIAARARTNKANGMDEIEQ